jgi:hypothetical protein
LATVVLSYGVSNRVCNRFLVYIRQRVTFSLLQRRAIITHNAMDGWMDGWMVGGQQLIYRSLTDWLLLFFAWFFCGIFY